MKSDAVSDLLGLVEKVVDDRFGVRVARIEALERRLDDPRGHVVRYGAMVERGVEVLLSLQASASVLGCTLTSAQLVRAILDGALLVPSSDE